MKRIITTLGVLVLLALSGCLSGGAPLDTKFHGLYMGQDISEARTVMAKLLEGQSIEMSVGEVKDGDQLFIHEIGVKGGKYVGIGFGGDNAASGAITADANGKVNGISLSAISVGHIWKVDDIDADKFAAAISAQSGINLQDDDGRWSYTSKSGLVVELDGLGGLIIKIAK